MVFWALNYSAFKDVDLLVFWGGFRFDLAAICFINSAFLIFSLQPFLNRQNAGYKLFLKIVFYISNIPFLLFSCIDLEYFKFTFKRSTYDLFSLVTTGTDTLRLIPQFLKDYWYIAFIFIFCVFLFNWLYNRTDLKEAEVVTKKNFQYFALHTFLLLIFTGLSILFARGIQLRPLSVINASQYADSKNINLVLNTPFTLIKSFGKNNLEELKYFSPEEALTYFNPKKIYVPFSSDFKQNNVVVILLESFSKEWIGLLNDSLQGYTPFLDSLIPHCLCVENSFANGKKSMEAFPSVLASIPSLMENPYITSVYSGNKINSLASILSENGYYSAFYHGGTNGTMGFDGFCKIAGFENYYGLNEYPNKEDNDGAWGIFDEPYLQYFANELSKKKQPFFCGVFTLSSHHPYGLPAKYESIFKGGKEPIARTIQYTDHSLKLFFNAAKKTAWYKNTLFVITADHTSSSNNYYYRNSIGTFAVPILFYKEGVAISADSNTIVEHADIMPSVLHLLGMKDPFISFGKSIFSNDEKFMVNYLNGTYWMVSKDRLLQFDGEKSVGYYNFKTDPMLEINLKGKERKQEEEMTNFLKAYLQQYNERLIKNNTIVE